MLYFKFLKRLEITKTVKSSTFKFYHLWFKIFGMTRYKLSESHISKKSNLINY